MPREDSSYGAPEPPGGTLPEPMGLQSQGGQVSPGTHSGHTQPQPPPPPPPEGGRWHTPETHGSPSMQGTPRLYQVHMLAVSARQVTSSVCSLHGSTSMGTEGAGEEVDVPSGASSQVQSQGSQVSPGPQAGQAQVQVPSPQPPPPPPSQVQSQGGQVAPSGQSGQTQVQSSPPPPGSGGQSHSHGGHSSPAGQ